MIEGDVRQLLECTTDAGFIVDVQGLTRSWNRAAEKLLGISASDAIGEPCARLIAGRDSLDALVCAQGCQVLQCIADGVPVADFDLKVTTGCGRCRWVNVSILWFREARTRSLLAVHLMRDIGARKKTEELVQKLLDSARDLVSIAKDPTPQAPSSPLTRQERRLLRALAAGRSPAEVAVELGITKRTVRNHLYNVNRKLGTRNRLQAVKYAERSGLI